MFKFLKEKFSEWMGKKKEPEEKTVSESKKKTPVQKTKKTEKAVKKGGEKSVEEELKRKADEIKEEAPLKFEVAKQKFEPDVEKLQEIKEEALESEKEFEKDFVDERAEELEKEIEKEEMKGAREREEALDKGIVEKKGFFGFLAKKLTTSELREEDFDLAFDEFEMTLLENNVALGVVDKIKESLKKDLVGKRFGKKEVEDKLLGALKNAIDRLLIEPPNLIAKIKEKKDAPYVMLIFGSNGCGKTTAIARLGWK